MGDATLKACIMSKKGGVPIHELNRDYKNLVGEDIQYPKSEFKSLDSFLLTIPGISVKGNMVTCVCKETEHIQEMINKQKSAPERRYNPKHTFSHNAYSVPSWATKRKALGDGARPSKRPNIDSKTKTKTIDESFHFLMSFMRKLGNCDLEFVHSERNQLYNLVFSLCSLIGSDQKLATLADQMGEDCYWLPALSQHSARPPNANTKVMPKLVLFGHQVVGDENMMYLMEGQFSNAFRSYSTCQANMTIFQARRSLIRQPCSPRVLLCVGTVDIYKGTPVELMIQHMQELILSVLLMGGQPTVLTLPPTFFPQHRPAILLFNYWLHSLTSVRVIDLFSHFFYKKSNNVNFDLFRRAPANSYSCMDSLWSQRGNQLVADILSKCSTV